MKQVVQSYKTGVVAVVDAPVPRVRPNFVLVRNVASVVSVGTERHMVEFARKSLLGKALARPDLVQQVVAKARTEGILEAYRLAVNRLDNPVPLGYSCAGVVLEVGPGVDGVSKGDRVACVGSGFASHAEVVCVPKNFCVKIPEGVDFESAAFVALGGIALEAVRLARTGLGDRVAVIGLGLLGQITVQLLKAAGCHVFGVDVVPDKVRMALEHGAEAGAVAGREDVEAAAAAFAPHGMDAVIIMAATPSNEPLEMAARLCRERGRVVAAGLVGLEVPRELFFDKELDLVVSRAWGPGTFDPEYVERGLDYPLPYARWTAKRNLEEFLAQLAKGTVRVNHLITHRFPIARAEEAYQLILESKEPYIGVLLTYPEEPALATRVKIAPEKKEQAPIGPTRPRTETIAIGLIGAGQFATSTLLPAMKGLKGLRLRGIATTKGTSARHVAQKFGFEYCTTNYQEILNDPEISLVFILTRHGSHAHLVVEALQAGKHVFVEKPLALRLEQLQEIVNAFRAQNANLQLLVGFNRRFSPFSRWLKEHFAHVAEPLAVHCTVNAGPVPPDHWVHDPEQGGGRIIGEVCHFVDLIQYLTGSVPVRVYAETLACERYKPSDNVVVTLKMANGAIGSITYVAGGDKRYPRERVEIFGGGAVGVIENFKAATFIRRGRKKGIRNWLSVDRGHRDEIRVLLDAIRTGGPAPVALEEYIYTTLTTFAIEESLRKGMPVEVNLNTLLSTENAH